jgi:hypothetical protein
MNQKKPAIFLHHCNLKRRVARKKKKRMKSKLHKRKGKERKNGLNKMQN